MPVHLEALMQCFDILSLSIFFPKLSEDLSGKRVGLVKEGFEICEQDVNDIVRGAANMLKGVGATVEEVSIPAHKDGE